MTIRIEDLANMDFADVVDPAAEQIPLTHPGEILLNTKVVLREALSKSNSRPFKAAIPGLLKNLYESMYYK